MAQTPTTTGPQKGPNLDDAFLREVDEEVRRDQLGQFWKRFGVLIVAAVVLLLAGLGGWLWWQEQRTKAAGAAGEELSKAIDKFGVGDNAAARPVLERLKRDGLEGYAAMARFMTAADQIAVGDEDKAATTLQALVDDASLAQPLRDAALIKLVRLRFDAMKPADVVAKLKPLAVPGNPWFGLAGETTALAHIKAGTPEPAKPLLIAIVRDEAITGSLRNRAAQLATSVGVEPEALGMGSAESTGVAPDTASDAGADTGADAQSNGAN